MARNSLTLVNDYSIRIYNYMTMKKTAHSLSLRATLFVGVVFLILGVSCTPSSKLPTKELSAAGERVRHATRLHPDRRLLVLDIGPHLQRGVVKDLHAMRKAGINRALLVTSVSMSSPTAM